MTNLFNHAELKDMNLEPCAYSTQWLVKGGKLHLIFKSAFAGYVSSEWLEYNAVCSIIMYVCTGFRIKSWNFNSQHW